MMQTQVYGGDVGDPTERRTWSGSASSAVRNSLVRDSQSTTASPLVPP